MRYYLKARKENGIYYICWTNPDGSPGRHSTGERSFERADLKLAAWKLEHDKPRDQAPSAVLLLEVLLRYWKRRGKKVFAPAVIKRVIKLVRDHCPAVTLTEFTVQAQERLAEQMNVAPNSQRRYMGVIAAALESARINHEITHYLPVQMPEAEDGPGTRPLELHELRAICAAAVHEHERRFVLLGLTSGARPQAILQLTWDRLKDGKANFRVPGRRRVKKRRAIAPLCSTVARYFDERRSVGPVIQWNDKPLAGHKMTFGRIANRAKVDATAYCLKKTLATWLRQQNVPEWECGAILAHRMTSSETEKYAHERPDYMAATKAAIEKLLALVAPGWLASYLPAAQPAEKEASQVPVAVGENGRREWDRTTDHFHVKDAIDQLFQSLTPANDD